MDERSLAAELVRRRPAPGPLDGPLVSVLVTNRNGCRHLERLLTGLDDRTHYRSFEVVLVDNGSTDGSVELFEAWGGPGRIVRNSTNQSFSAANNQGIASAEGELVLLANNDIDPIHPHWLGYLVETLRDGPVAVGAMLVYPVRPPQEHPPEHPDLTVQHLGVAFERSKWGVRARNLGVGTDPLEITTPTRRPVPAVTAACLLARRVDLLETPFDERYWYGAEDWDLCLRLIDRGSVVVDGRAVLFHHEYGTQVLDDGWNETRAANHRWFNERWGPTLQRRLRAETLNPRTDGAYRADRSRTLLLTGGDRAVSTALREQAEAAGWQTIADERSPADLAILCDVPRFPHRIAGYDLSAAVVADRHADWVESGALDAVKRVHVADPRGRATLDALWGRGIAQLDRSLTPPSPQLFEELVRDLAPDGGALRIGISTAAPSWDAARTWGDTFLAAGLMRAFRRLGHETTELVRTDWRDARATGCDVVIHLRGLHRRATARGQRNVLWIISHPERIAEDECDDYDIVASASRIHAERLSDALDRPVHFLPQATDADAFTIGPRSPEFSVPVLYVGIARWPSRRAPRWMLRNDRRFHLYGPNWESEPEAHMLCGEFIANRDLASAYRSASIVVADHHGTMRTGGFVANRLFDVLASGGLVLSDDVAGIEELFGEAVPTYSNARELESQIRVLLADDALRRRLSSQGRRIVQEHHTLDHRAAEFLRLLDEL